MKINKNIIELIVDEVIRPFSAGSRQTPDPYDQFLDDHGFYRKHTARDASCLFRVVAEQIYDIQDNHERVRAECVDFMQSNPAIFEATIKSLGRDFDTYCADMQKPRTRGTLLELKAMGMLYEANVVLFEPLTTGRWLSRPLDNFTRTIRVFFALPAHFDTVYTMDYMRKAALCQAVVYEILYKQTFKLADVDFAVEKMLHDPQNENLIIEHDKNGHEKAVTSDGRILEFDSPDKTLCILSDFRFCQFHNNEGFGFEVSKHAAGNEKTGKKKSQLGMFLYNEKISCVRKLLEEGVTPFPYKVAKALDSSMYRNVEYDTWAESRRDKKFQDWYYGANDFKVGNYQHDSNCMKLLKRPPFNNKMYATGTTAIDRYTSIEYFRPPLQRIIALPMIVRQDSLTDANKQTKQIGKSGGGDEKKESEFEFSPDRPTTDSGYTDVSSNTDHSAAAMQYGVPPPQFNAAIPTTIAPYAFPTGPAQLWSNEVSPATPFAGPMHAHGHVPHNVNHAPSELVGYGEYPPTTEANIEPIPIQYGIPPPPLHAAYQPVYVAPAPYAFPANPMGTVNFAVVQSTQPDGSDLPLNDFVTLRFFYNYGIDAYNRRFTGTAQDTPSDPENVSQALTDLRISDQSTNSVDVKPSYELYNRRPMFNVHRGQGNLNRRPFGRRGRGGRGGFSNDRPRDFGGNNNNGHNNRNSTQIETANQLSPPAKPNHGQVFYNNEYEHQQFVPFMAPVMPPQYYPYQVMPQFAPQPVQGAYGYEYQQNAEFNQNVDRSGLWYPPPNPPMGGYYVVQSSQVPPTYAPNHAHFQQPNNGNGNNY